jgi:hypothetical protein
MIEKKTVQTYCMKNQLPELISLLKKTDSDDEYYTRFKNRFVNHEKQKYDIDNPLLISILHAFEEYYTSVFFDRLEPKKAKKQLRIQLCKLHQTNRLTMYFLERDIKKLFEKEGFHFKGNDTSGFRGPYIWKTTEEKKYQVEIPNGTIELPVYFMHGYIMNSWLDYISLGTVGTGGWSEKKGLYCNFNLYKDRLDTPNFNVSFLKHESQHTIDSKNKKYYMNTTVLEYRAKLAELVYYPNLDLLRNFMLDAKDDKRLTHPQSQYWIIEELSKHILNKDYVDDIKEFESKLQEIQQFCKEQLLAYNRCKRNRLTATFRYYITTLFF